MKSIVLALSALAILAGAPLTFAQEGVSIVAAENVYGDVARQIAGESAGITSILSNPDEDPHLFESSPSTARAVADARIVIFNGAGYDPWMEKLLSAAPAKNRAVIEAGALLRRKAGVNPHLWYDPPTMPAIAQALAQALDAADPGGKAGYERRLRTFLASLRPLSDKIADMRARHAGAEVTATEPVFGYMAAALGLKMRNERFQLAVMNDTEPAASDVAAFERDLKTHKVRVLLYNKQASDASAERLRRIAEDAKVPVVGVTETEPAGVTYQDWMLRQLDELDAALSTPTK